MTTNTPRSGRRFGGRVARMCSIAAVTLATAVSPLPAKADPAVSPASNSFSITGAGFGHGWGMSQYGAYGAAKQGLTWRQIVSFYYPETTQVQQPVGTTIKVWITADRDNDLKVLPAAGLRLRDSSGNVHMLPSGASYTAWRVTRSGQGFALSHRTASGSWVKRSTPLKTGSWWFSSTAKAVEVWLPGGARREFRGSVALVKRDSGGRTVNRVGMEDYVRAVVPAEMPTSWHPEAVAAQTVAARSYGARLKELARAGSGYHVCDTTSCQVYRGLAGTRSGRRAVYETQRGNAAVKATARTIVTYRGAVALTQFASSNGGATARGDHPYLTAQADPYDGVITSNRWSRTVSVDTLERLWPTAGTVRQLRVTGRDGSGRWGGRVTSVTLVGSQRSVLVSGATFSSRLGLRSRLFTLAP